MAAEIHRPSRNSLSALMTPIDILIDKIFQGQQRVSKVLFRVDAGRISGLSFGHISRCIVLADALIRKFGADSIFLMRDILEGIRYAEKAGRRVVTISRDADAIAECKMIIDLSNQFKPDWLIVDLPYLDIDTSYFSSVRMSGAKVLFIDDARFITPDADVLLNSSILAVSRTEIRKGANVRHLLGPEYFIFDDASLRSGCDRREGVLNIAITFGGSDPSDITQKAVRSLIWNEFRGVLFRIILGPGYSDVEKIQRLTADHAGFEVIVNPPSLFPLLAGSDAAICAGGRTMYELAYLGKSCLPVASTAHEAAAIQEFIKAGFVKCGIADWSEDVFLGSVKNIISDLSAKPSSSRQGEIY